jgi:capsular polysaccharide biosynthesis protein
MTQQDQLSRQRSILLRLKGRLRWLRAPYDQYVRRGALFIAANAVQRMPGDSLTFGPPRRVGRAAGAPAGAACRAVLEPERLVFDNPRSITPQADFWPLVESSPDLGAFARTADGARYRDVPSGQVYTLPRGRVLGAQGWIIDADDRLLTDLSPDYVRERRIRSRHPAMNLLRLPAPHTVEGSVAVLATLSARDFYGHWIMDLVPRAALLRRGGFDFADFDGIYLPKPRHQYQVDLLAQLGIDLEQIIDSDAVPHLRASLLVVPSWHSNVFLASQWCCQILRELIPTAPEAGQQYPRLIYVSRSGAAHRRIVNEDELLRDVLQPRGFVVVRPERLTSAQKAKLFSRAKVVVAPLGSSLANLVHCGEGTQVVEIMNPRCVQPCTLALATQLGMGYHVVLARGVNPAQHEITEDLHLPKSRLEQGIEQALSSIR